MPDANDWNQGIITEFRANEGRVGGPFEGAPMILVHHVGRTSGKQYTTPLVYLPGEDGDDALYIFASKGGAPVNPAWYGNLIAAGPSPSPRSPATNATASSPSRSSACPASATTRSRPRASARFRCSGSPAGAEPNRVTHGPFEKLVLICPGTRARSGARGSELSFRSPQQWSPSARPRGSPAAGQPAHVTPR